MKDEITTSEFEVFFDLVLQIAKNTKRRSMGSILYYYNFPANNSKKFNNQAIVMVKAGDDGDPLKPPRSRTHIGNFPVLFVREY